MFVWVQFGMCLSLIGIAGVKLTRYGDAIADKTGLVRTWVGVVLLASVTSLPELAPGISSVTIASVLLFVLYAVAIRTVFRYEMRPVGEFTDQGPDRYPHVTLRQTVLRYLVAAAVVSRGESGYPSSVACGLRKWVGPKLSSERFPSGQF